MDTKLKGDIAEQAVILQALKRGWGVLRPVGDRLPYDLVIDINGRLVKVQVKSAWHNQAANNFVIDTRRTKTNRRVMIRSRYQSNDFDFAIAYLPEVDIFYIFPAQVFLSYGSELHMVESNKRQRKPRSATYRDVWQLMAQWAAQDGSLA